MASQSSNESIQDILSKIAENTDVKYDPNNEEVDFIGDKNDTQHYIDLVRFLISEEYITEDDLPVAAPRAQTRYLIYSTPDHENRDMIRPVKIAEDFYLETNHDSVSKKRYATLFISTFVLDRE